MKNTYPFLFLAFCACREDSSLQRAKSSQVSVVQEFEPKQVALASQFSGLQYFLNPQVEANFSSLTTLQIPCYQNNQLILKTHIIRPGQTLNTLSHAYSVHIHDIIANNPELIYGARRQTPIQTQRNIANQKKPKSKLRLFQASKQDVAKNAMETPTEPDPLQSLFSLKPGNPWSNIDGVFSKAEQKETIYSDIDGIHRVIAITLPNKTEPSFEFYANTQKTKSDELVIRKVVIKDPDILVSQSIKVGSSVREIVQQFPNPMVTTAKSSVVIIPEKSEKMALVLEAFSIEWRPDGAYKLKDIPDHVRVRSIQLF